MNEKTGHLHSIPFNLKQFRLIHILQRRNQNITFGIKWNLRHFTWLSVVLSLCRFVVVNVVVFYLHIFYTSTSIHLLRRLMTANFKRLKVNNIVFSEQKQSTYTFAHVSLTCPVIALAARSNEMTPIFSFVFFAIIWVERIEKFTKILFILYFLRIYFDSVTVTTWNEKGSTLLYLVICKQQWWRDQVCWQRL